MKWHCKIALMIAHCQLLVIGLFLFKNKDKCLRYVF